MLADGEYDAIVMGTGLKEAIMSGLLSTLGMKVSYRVLCNVVQFRHTTTAAAAVLMSHFAVLACSITVVYLFSFALGMYACWM